MRKILAVGLLALMAAPAGAAEDWWRSSDRTMPQFAADGFQVVGYSAIPEVSRVMPLISFRYILQKGTALVLCTEKYAASSGGAPFSSTCYTLKEAPASQ